MTYASPEPRRRLDPVERIGELLDIGARTFASTPYEEVTMSSVAEEAGVSRALLYRYFASKRDFFAAVYQREADRLLEATEIGPGFELTDYVVDGLDAHFDFFEANARTMLVANRGALAGDPVVQGIIASELAVLRVRVLDALGLEGEARAVVSVGLGGWLHFVRAVSVEWIAEGAIGRDELRELCLGALAGVLGSRWPGPDGGGR